MRALVIEDDDNNLLLITRLLEAAGYSVQAARSGEEGITQVLSERPDFVILDIGLPDIDGFEVLKRLRQSPSNGDLPIIAMTSFAMAGDRQRVLTAGCTGYIEKPIKPRTVVGEIEAVLAANGAATRSG